jgi:hypothetical protein
VQGNNVIHFKIREGKCIKRRSERRGVRDHIKERITFVRRDKWVPNDTTFFKGVKKRSLDGNVWNRVKRIRGETE